MPARHSRTSVESDDRNLVLAFQAGHRNAYDEIYRRYQPMAQRICRRYLPNPADAEEAAQETMLRVLRSLQEFNGRYAVRAWVARIATNVCLDALRAHGRRNGEDLNGALPEPANGNGGNGDDPGELVERRAHQQEVQHHLARLPERHRIALVLREVEGMSHHEIATLLSTTAPRVKALLHRARRGFRQGWNGGDARSLVLLPFTLLADSFRKLWGRAVELGASTQAVAAPSPSVVSTAADRIPTAVAAVIVAGAVGFAGSTRSSSPPQSPDRPPPAVVVEQAAAQPDGPAARAPKQDARDQKRTHDSKTAGPGNAAAGEPETLALSSSQDVDTAAPGPVQEAPDGVRPAPAQPSGFTFSFSSDWTGSDECGCSDEPSVAEQSVKSSTSALQEFSTRIVGGAVRDASGQPRWRVEVRQSGKETEHHLEFYVWTNAGTHSYAADGAPVKKERTAWGGWAYTFSGSYLWRGGPGEVSPLPARGTYTAVLSFSLQQGRLVDAVISLSQSEASSSARPALLASLI